MSNLVFRGANADAALHLVTKTVLYTSPAVVYLTLDDEWAPNTVHVSLVEGWRWSSGEVVLLGLLNALSTRRHLFQLDALWVLDAPTRVVALRAIGLAVGLSALAVEVSA